jgi:gamma-glutamyltranspeptidase/glutathione hydrolase
MDWSIARPLATELRLIMRVCAVIAIAALPLAAPQAQPATASRQMVAAAHPLAAEAGLDILRRGGSAVDAAIATQLVLTLVEPQAAGIGGSSFMMVYRASDRAVRAYDGRETAPAAARLDRFLGYDGQPLPYDRSGVGGIAVGVPGMLRLYELAHRAHGKLPWRDLFTAPIALAENGFPASPRLVFSIERNPQLSIDSVASALFRPGGAPLKAGEPHRNPALAATFRAVAEQGADAFYRGPIAGEIAAAVRNSVNAGDLTEGDMASYRAVERAPVCGPYRKWRVCSMPPPSSGGIALLQMLAILERFDLAALGPNDPRSAHLLAEAGRLAFADRDTYVADPDFVATPPMLLDRAYLAGRSALVDVARSMGIARPGDLPERRGMVVHAGSAGTSQVSVVAANGDAVSMTSSVGDAFGARIVAGGFVLNNELTDFTPRPADASGAVVANRVEPGKRPRSSMAPALVFDESGQLVLAVGSQGGARIIGFVAKMVVASLDWGLDIQAAIDLPHMLNRNGVTELETGPGRDAVKAALEGMGHSVRLEPIDSGQQGIARTAGGWSGGGDRRREGTARGD